MRRLAVILAVFFAGIASAAAPVGIVLTVGQWLLENQQRVFQVEVESIADTADEARQTAFRLAVEQAVGTIIVSETESNNWQLQRNEIITYASGYVDRYKILQQRNTPNGITMRVRVWVAHSGIANRLLNQSRGAGVVDGDRASVQVESLTHQRQTGDQLLNTVLRDYPRRAFELALEPTRVEFDHNRQAWLQIPFRMQWSKLYLTSLTEALTAVNQFPKCAGLYNGCKNARSSVVVDINTFTPNPGAWFADDSLRVVRYNLEQDPPVYKLTLWANEQPITQCFRAHELDNTIYSSHKFVTIQPSVVTIQGKYTSRIVLVIAANSMPLKDLGKTEVEVVRSSQCISTN